MALKSQKIIKELHQEGVETDHALNLSVTSVTATSIHNDSNNRHGLIPEPHVTVKMEPICEVDVKMEALEENNIFHVSIDVTPAALPKDDLVNDENAQIQEVKVKQEPICDEELEMDESSQIPEENIIFQIPIAVSKDELIGENSSAENKQKCTTSIPNYSNNINTQVPGGHNIKVKEEPMCEMEFEMEEISSIPEENKIYIDVPMCTKDELIDNNYSTKTEQPFSVIEDMTINNDRFQNDAKPLVCDLCNIAFKHSSKFEKHMRTHNGGKPYVCQFCNRTFRFYSTFTRHQRTHTGEKPYECDFCNKQFTRKHHLLCHVTIHTKEKSHKCKWCHQTFARRDTLQYHIRTHTGEKPYECGMCNKTFIRKHHLQCHIRVHTREKSHKCKLCHKTFSRKDSLQYHIRTHTGEKPYKCDSCNKTFTHKHHLQCHETIHTREKPHECKYCNKTFARKDTLRCHIKIHTGEKPFECGLCQKTFVRKHHLQCHINVHARENMS